MIMENLKDVDAGLTTLQLVRPFYVSWEDDRLLSETVARLEEIQPAATPVPEPDPENVTEPAPRPLSDEKLNKLLALARERGIEWARTTLASHNVKKFTDLLDDEAAAILS